MTAFLKLARNDTAATAIEYAVIAALISVAAVVGFKNLGTKVDGMYNNVSNAL